MIAGESSRDFEKPKSAAVLGDEKREGRECEGPYDGRVKMGLQPGRALSVVNNL